MVSPAVELELRYWQHFPKQGRSAGGEADLDIKNGLSDLMKRLFMMPFHVAHTMSPRYW